MFRLLKYPPPSLSVLVLRISILSIPPLLLDLVSSNMSQTKGEKINVFLFFLPVMKRLQKQGGYGEAP